MTIFTESEKAGKRCGIERNGQIRNQYIYIYKIIKNIILKRKIKFILNLKLFEIRFK